jgi:hypothetical protein
MNHPVLAPLLTACAARTTTVSHPPSEGENERERERLLRKKWTGEERKNERKEEIRRKEKKRGKEKEKQKIEKKRIVYLYKLWFINYINYIIIG